MKTTLVLDYSTWRSGGSGNNQLGKGRTMMYNEEGFMCCLGQFTPQLNPDIKSKHMLNCATPAGVLTNIHPEIALLTQRNGLSMNSELSNHAMVINDTENTTPEEKIEALKKLFAEHNIEITVINKPE